MIAVLHSLFGVNRVSPHVNVNEDMNYQFRSKEYEQYDVIVGHFGVKWHDSIGPGRRWLTLLREPVDRVLSTYYFWRNNVPKTPNINYLHLAQTSSLEQFLSSDDPLIAQGVRNSQTWQLADDLRIRYRSVSLDDALAVAKHNLAERFEYVGIHKYFDESVALLCSRIGNSVPANVPRLNITSERLYCEDMPKHITEKIIEMNLCDIELYDLAVKRFERERRDVDLRSNALQ